MRTLVLAVVGIAVAAAVLLVREPALDAGQASSHREAPMIAESPTDDNTDLYAYRSSDAPNSLTVIAKLEPGRGHRGRPELAPVLVRSAVRDQHRPERGREGRRHLPLPLPQP